MRERDYAASLTRMSAHARVEEILSEGAADGIPSARGRDYTLAADCVRVMQAIAEGKLIEIQDTGHSHAYRRFIVRTDNGLFEHDADPLTAALKALEARDMEDDRERAIRCAIAGIEHGASVVDVSAVQREAASRAWDARSRWGLGDDSEREKLSVAERDRYLATTHPAPAPRECVLSDGSVVTVHDGMFKWYGSTVGHLTTRNWRDLADTGADFDALKQFAERAK